jgi:hypothetical protein
MENALDNVKGDGVVRAGFTDARREDEAENSGARLLIGTHGVEQSRRWDPRPGRKRSEAANQRNDSRDVVGTRQAEFVAEKSRGDHAPGNGFSMLVAAVFRHGFEGMREGVAEIEDFAQARLAFVAADDASFDRYVAWD